MRVVASMERECERLRHVFRVLAKSMKNRQRKRLSGTACAKDRKLPRRAQTLRPYSVSDVEYVYGTGNISMH